MAAEVGFEKGRPFDKGEVEHCRAEASQSGVPQSLWCPVSHVAEVAITLAKRILKLQDRLGNLGTAGAIMQQCYYRWECDSKAAAIAAHKPFT